VSLAPYKTLAFGVSAAYAGIAGGLFAIASAFVNPDTFPVALSIFLLVGVVVGGLGGLSGLVFGAIFIAFVPLWSQGQDLGSLLPDRIIQETQKPGGPSIVYGVVLIQLMFVLPNGVDGLFRRIGQLFTSRRYSRSQHSRCSEPRSWSRCPLRSPARFRIRVSARPRSCSEEPLR
jgi:branched-chain amino acid transport system permease protein